MHISIMNISYILILAKFAGQYQSMRTMNNKIMIPLALSVFLISSVMNPFGIGGDSGGEEGTLGSGATEVYNQAQLQDMTLYGNYILMNDIKLNADFVPIGEVDNELTGEDAFTGTLDGNGYTITLNMKISGDIQYGGLFGAVSGATIKNLTVAGTVSAESAVIAYAGGIAGYVFGEGIILENCTSNVKVTVTASIAIAGGLIGHVFSSAKITMTNCLNSGDVTVTAHTANAGGIAGFMVSSEVTITGCSNTGAVKVTALNTTAGGIAGFMSGFKETTITGCSNSGAVEADGAGIASAGGIAGLIPGSKVTITNCYNTGNIKAAADDEIGRASCRERV